MKFIWIFYVIQVHIQIYHILVWPTQTLKSIIPFHETEYLKENANKGKKHQTVSKNPHRILRVKQNNNMYSWYKYLVLFGNSWECQETLSECWIFLKHLFAIDVRQNYQTEHFSISQLCFWLFWVCIGWMKWKWFVFNFYNLFV